jgi:hypothetical protein
MKMHEIIDKVSVLYREELKKTDSKRDELYSILNTLEKVHESKGKDITVAEYNNLLKRKDELIEEIKLNRQYCDGISCVRELLMDLGFETKIE